MYLHSLTDPTLPSLSDSTIPPPRPVRLPFNTHCAGLLIESMVDGRKPHMQLTRRA